ncbi:MAG TPA: hypothetical protein VM509_12350, partial [Planctomycetota bacterium]|nr:hypothetical protein [Planctomycetota bacterium]
MTGPGHLAPGDTAIVQLAYFPRLAVDRLTLGATFTLREGPRIVGHGKVLGREDGGTSDPLWSETPPSSLKHGGLDTQGREIVGRCLLAAAEGPYFPDEEFEVLFGLTRDEVTEIARAWPAVDESSGHVQLAINDALANLLGYPHGRTAALERSVAASDA